MADKFGFGNISPIVKSLGHWPGQQYSAIGPRLVIPGLNTDADFVNVQYGFGEIVKVLEYKEGAYQFRPMETGDNATQLAVIMRDVVGGNLLQEGPIPYGKPNVPCSLYLLSDEQHGAISVPCAATASVAVGGTPYVGLGTNNTVAGSVYGAAQGGGGADSIALTGYEFKTLPYKPSDNNAYAVIIGKKLDI